MFRIEYYHADTGDTAVFHKFLKKDALKMLDRFIDNGPDNVKKVSAMRVDFKNGDYACIAAEIPLSAIRISCEDRGYDNDGSDSIFDEDL